MGDISYLLPLLFVGVGAVVLMLLSYTKSLSISSIAKIALGFLVLAFISNVYYFGELHKVYPYENVFFGMIVSDTYSVYFNSILLVGAIATILIGWDYFRPDRRFTGEFFSLLLFSTFGMMLLVQSAELLSAFIALEIASLSLYVMIGFQTDNIRRVEASYRYLVLGSLSGVLFLFGTALIYASTKTTFLGNIGVELLPQTGKDISLAIGGATLILITFLFKISAFPFQNWTIDVYDGSPLPVSAYMASTFKVAVFAFMLRFVAMDLGYIKDYWDGLLMGVIILTLAYGTFLALAQNNLKRMLASSSIVHTGYLLIAFVSIDIIGESASSSIIYYLIAYFLSAMGAFGLISYISSSDKLRLTYEDFKGFSHVRPYMSAMLSIFMLSLAGLPGTIGFIGKFYIFSGAIEAGYTVLATSAILATFISIYYYFKLIALMYFYPSPILSNVPPLKGLPPIFIGFIAIAVLWGGIGNTFIAFFPSIDFLIDVAKLSHRSLFLQ
ncbi:MAG: NADH-quinone oxidoreductase subunit N [Sulfurospirillaceae bacterium]|nr:NADH-quinone oxidoreductase subunit N [Sulfurospirillaceae bacterium]